MPAVELSDPLLAYLKPGFPKKGVSGGSYTTALEYIGDYNSLEVGAPATGSAWGIYEGTVGDVNIEPIPGTNPKMGELSINMVRDYQAGSDGTTLGEESETTYEVEWVVVNRPLLEHPEFRSGGTYDLSAEGYQTIATWEGDRSESNYSALSTNGKKYADGINSGVSTYDDFAPVLTITTSYVNGPPSSSEAGAKDTPPVEFPNAPSGYEWVKSADRSMKSGRKNKWDRIEQWLGAIKVLVDKDTLYY